MTSYILESTANLSEDKPVRSAENHWTKWHTGALVGLVGGLTILIGTTFLTAFEYFSGERSHGGWLFFTVLGLMIFGAHCLDKIGTANKTAKIENHRRKAAQNGERL